MIRLPKTKLCADREDAKVGIWWWTGDEIWAYACEVDDGVEDGAYIQASGTENHMTLWEPVAKEQGAYPDILRKGYRYFERGRTVYYTIGHVFSVVCSPDLVNDDKFRRAIIQYFHLEDCRVEFEASNHYLKVDLSNPALAAFDFMI